AELHEPAKGFELSRSLVDLLQVRLRVRLQIFKKTPGNPLDVVGGEELAAETLGFVVAQLVPDRVRKALCVGEQLMASPMWHVAGADLIRDGRKTLTDAREQLRHVAAPLALGAAKLIGLGGQRACDLVQPLEIVQRAHDAGVNQKIDNTGPQDFNRKPF